MTAENPRVWAVDEIRQRIVADQEWTERALVALHQRQTDDEQLTRSTQHHNKMGFNGVDAKIMSSFAERVRSGRHLTPKQFVIAQRKIKKYAGQLTRIANGQL